MIEQNGCDECVPMIRILLFSSGNVENRDNISTACAKCEDTSSWFLLRKSWLRHFQYFALQNPAPTHMRHTAATTNVQPKIF